MAVTKQKTEMANSKKGLDHYPLAREMIEDSLMRGAVDMHAHGFPEISLNYRGRQLDSEWGKTAEGLKMGGFVIKSHLWPTMERAYLLQEQFENLTVFGSITLNPNVGGLSPWALESAIRLGARVIWLPTWGALFDMKRMAGKTFRRYLPSLDDYYRIGGINLLNESGGLKDEAKQIVKIALAADMIIGTGHISPSETLKLAEFCCQCGFKKLISTHPLHLGFSLEIIEEIAGLGSYIELSSLHILLQSVRVSDMVETIRKVGHQNCILTSDAFFSWTPPAPEMLRMIIGILISQGIEARHIRHMVYVNPRRLLGIKEPRKGQV